MTRQDLYKLIDTLPEDELDNASDYLQSLCEQPEVPARWEDIPFDDEPLTDDDHRALDAAKANIAAGNYVTQEEIECRLGLE